MCTVISLNYNRLQWLGGVCKHWEDTGIWPGETQKTWNSDHEFYADRRSVLGKIEVDVIGQILDEEYSPSVGY